MSENKKKGNPMTNKSNSTHQKPTLLKEKDQTPLQTKEKFLSIAKKMLRLRQKREKLHMNQALFFTKEIQKIMGEDHSLETALVAFEKTWTAASTNQKKEWQMHEPSFRSPLKSHHQKSDAHNAVFEALGVSEVHPHERS